jgi:hypothetical protein
VRSNRSTNGRRYPWERLTQRELLSVRLCDLNVSIEGTWLKDQIERVRDKLARRDLRFNPHFWLSDEWFSPAGLDASVMRHERDQKQHKENEEQNLRDASECYRYTSEANQARYKSDDQEY